MTDWRSCDNCGRICGLKYDPDILCCFDWKKLPCQRCGGALSEIREHNGKKYRHCYACHAEFFEVENE